MYIIAGIVLLGLAFWLSNKVFDNINFDEVDSETNIRKENLKEKYHEAQKVADVWKENDKRNNS